MFLKFTTIDSNGIKKNYSWWFCSMEFAFEVLSSLVARGRLIVEAELLDQQNRLRLDVSAFDGESFLQPMQKLEWQWQSLLRAPRGISQSGLNEPILTISTPPKA